VNDAADASDALDARDALDAADARDDVAAVAVGTHSPTCCELPSELVGRSFVVVEERESALREAGDVVCAITAGLMTPDDIAATIGAYRDIVGHAPAAIEPEWQQLVDALEAASAIDPADPVSVASVTDTALRTAPAAVRIQQFTQQTCTLDIGTPPPPTNPVTATAPDTAPGTSGG
jgi:hypothetical protein